MFQSNIFYYRKGDGAAYLVFYIFIPVVVTAVSLLAFPENNISMVYCYVTILVSALNSIYDSAMWLFVYFLAVLVSLLDVVACFVKDMAFCDWMEKRVEEDK